MSSACWDHASPRPRHCSAAKARCIPQSGKSVAQCQKVNRPLPSFPVTIPRLRATTRLFTLTFIGDMVGRKKSVIKDLVTSSCHGMYFRSLSLLRLATPNRRRTAVRARGGISFRTDQAPVTGPDTFVSYDEGPSQEAGSKVARNPRHKIL